MTIKELKADLLAQISHIEYCERQGDFTEGTRIYRFNGNDLKEYQGFYLEEGTFDPEDGSETQDILILWQN